MKKVLALILVAIFAVQVNAQEAENITMRPAIGLFGGLNVNMHSPDIPFYYESLTDPSKILLASRLDQNTTSLGYHVGLLGYIPLSDYIVIAPRIGYNSMNVLFKKNLNLDVTAADPTQSVEYSIDREYDAKLSYLELSPVVQFHNLLPIKPLYFMLGMEFGFPMSTSVHHLEKHTLNKAMMIQKDTSMNIQEDITTRMALALGVGYTFELSDYVKLSAEVSYRLPFNNVSTFKNPINDVNPGTWKANQLRAGISLTFDIGGREKPVENTVVKESSSINLKMNAINAVSRDGRRTAMRAIRVEDQQYTELFPFVSYVFFDENTANVAGGYENMSRGNEAGQTFSISTLPSDAVKINSNTLNIVGTRMLQYPNATITITGTFDNKKEKNKSLSNDRANIAKNFLVNEYGIDESRIRTVAAGLPSRPSSQILADGLAENRRIEVTSDDPRITEPILITGENIRIAMPDVVEFTPLIETKDAPISSFEMDLFQGGRNIKTIHGDFEPSTIQWAIAPNDLANRDMPVEYILKVRSEDANIENEIKGSIPVEYLSITKRMQEELADKTVSRYSLTLFDFDKSEVSASDMAIIDKYIVPAIKYNSTVDIYGYTDRTGDANYNMKLSQRRAEAVMQLLQSRVSEAKYNAHGVGESVEIFDNESPVGRHLSRTVQIYITTPR